MSLAPLDFIDGGGNHRDEQADLVSGNYIPSRAIADPVTGNRAAVGSVTGDDKAISSAYGLFVAAVGQMRNIIGNFDDWANAGLDFIAPRGVMPVSAMLAKAYDATSTTSVAPGTGSTTLLVGDTTGFTLNSPITLEPGAANQEAALVTAIIANTSVSVTFPAGGAVFTHTQPFAVQMFRETMPREAPGGTGVALVSLDGTNPTYRTGAVAQTLYSTAAAVLVEIVGSATATVRVKQITIWAQAATLHYAELTLLRCTAASAGTPAVANNGQHDTTDGAGTAVVNYYTAAAAEGTGHLVTGAQPLNTSAPSATMPLVKTVWNFCENGAKGLILRGISDILEVYNNTTGLGTATFGFEAVWEED